MSGSDLDIGAANAWKSFDKWLDNFTAHNKAAKEIQDEVSQQLFNDGCDSAWIHRAYFIERLVEIIEELQEADDEDDQIKLTLNAKYSKPFHSFPGGHLLENISRTKAYPIVESEGRAGLKIIDDAGNDVWISNSVRREYFELI